jgi:hypothetical protein
MLTRLGLKLIKTKNQSPRAWGCARENALGERGARGRVGRTGGPCCRRQEPCTKSRAHMGAEGPRSPRAGGPHAGGQGAARTGAREPRRRGHGAARRRPRWPHCRGAGEPCARGPRGNVPGKAEGPRAREAEGLRRRWVGGPRRRGRGGRARVVVGGPRAGLQGRAHVREKKGAHAGKERGGRGREGEGRGAYLRVQIRRSPFLKPRAPRGERERGGRGGCCAGELNEEKRPGEGARAWGRGRALGAREPKPGRAGPGRVGLGWATPRVKIPWHSQPEST